MPRKPRFYLAGVPVHIVQRGPDIVASLCFFDRQDYVTYLHWVKESDNKYNVAVHAFVLMQITYILYSRPMRQAALAYLCNTLADAMYPTSIISIVAVVHFGRDDSKHLVHPLKNELVLI